MAGCDSSFGWNDLHGPTPNGRRWSRIVWANLRTRAAAAVITGALSKRCCGSRGQEVPGAIFRYSSATGKQRLLALTDALGNLVRFVLLPGHRFDTVGVAPLIDGIAFGGLIADKAFDSNAIIANLNERGAKIVISQHPRRALPLRLDTELYKWRHLIENFFCKLKEFKRIAMRADKTDQSFAAIIHLAAAVINFRTSSFRGATKSRARNR